MVSEIQNSELVDPLHGHSGLSLFPRTIRASTDPSNPRDPDDLQSIHDFMKSMGLRNPQKLLEKAKAVISGGSEVLNSSFVAVMDNNGTFAAKGKENPQERRPGSGRKRARFSLKPGTSKPIMSLEASLEIDHLQNPEEFLSAYEKLENARKEIQRQTGGNTTYLNEYNSSMNARRRRPGMLGKSVSYKHCYSSVLSENNNTFTSCQDILEQEVLSPPNPDLREETADMDVETQEIELAGSIAKTESRVNELLHELLSSNNEDLEGNRAFSLLLERLQIKPLDLGKLCLPDFSDTGKTDFAAFQEKLPRRHNSLSDVHNLVKGIREKTPAKHKQVAESSMHSLESPAPPRSPFASILLLKKQISQLNPLRDPFSPLNVDLSAIRYHSSVEHIEKQSEQIVIREKSRTSSKLKSLEGDETTKTMVANTGLQKVITGGSVHLPDESLNDTSSRQCGGISFSPIGSHGDLEDRGGCQNMGDWTMDTSASRPNTDTDVLLNGPNDMEENVTFFTHFMH
ncbi:unnamed protein product [Ilex paraguariensis]|uniref:Uncharacterized protein n=1 Tax=Ilex paraguariensis TaxID=185542 RepID=A0ABC8RH14_9AQUA